MRPGLTISVIAHAVVLSWGLVAFAARPSEAPPVEALPVEFVSANDLSQMTAGVKNAPKRVDQPKPLADKVGDLKQVKQLAPKAADKPEVTTDAKAAPPPEPRQEPKKAEPKPEKAEKPDKAEKPKEPPKDAPKPDAIAEALKKEEAKKPLKPDKPKPQFKPDAIAEALKRDEKKDRPQTKYDANQIAALLDKREPQRQIASAERLNDAPSLGTATGQASQLSQSEMDALRARLSQCWNPPPGIDVNSNLYVVLHVLFKPDGSLSGEPAVVETSQSALGPALAESAKRALLGCQPFTMLKPAHYDSWKDIEVKFDPHELLGG
jgi:colicin import membrane protein